MSMPSQAFAVDSNFSIPTTNPDDKLFVQFSMHPVYDPIASEGCDEYAPDGRVIGRKPGAGRAVYRDVEWIKIMIPGDRSTILEREVREDDKRRFARQYATFKRDGEEQVVGTPIETLAHVVPPVLTFGQIEEYRHFGVRTIEQLVGMADGLAAKFPGHQAIKQKAERYITAATADAPLAALRKANEEQAAQIANLQSMVERLAKLAEQKPARTEKPAKE